MENSNKNNEMQKILPMIQSVKHYFPEKEQRLLCKVEDFFSIFNKFNDIVNDNYNRSVSVNKLDTPTPQKIEILMKEVSKHMGGDKKALVDDVLIAKENILKAKSQITNSNNSEDVKVNAMDTLNTIINLMNSMKPIMKEEQKTRMRKIEKMVQIMNSSEKGI